MILRHLEAKDWPRVPTLPYFDGFMLQGGQQDPAVRAAATALAATKAGFLYANVHNRPPAEWGPFPSGAPWLDAVIAYTEPLTHPDGRKAISWNKGREMIAWPLVDGGKLDALTDVLVSEVRTLGLQGVMLDLAWTRPHYWMFRHDGPAFEEFPAGWWPNWERRFRKFVQLLGAKLASAFPERPSPLRLLLNGDRVVIQVGGALGGRGGFYREHAQNNWASELYAWGVSGGADVLSVLADDTEAMYRLLAAGEAKPDLWIAFTGHSETAVDQAYELAGASGPPL